MAGEGLFKTRIVVQIGDINYGKHVGNDRFLLYFQEARLRFLASLGASEADLGGGVGTIMTEAQVAYKSQARWGDELELSVRVADPGRARFALEYEAVNLATGAKVAEGKTVLVAYDYAAERVARLPEEFLNKLTACAAEG